MITIKSKKEVSELVGRLTRKKCPNFMIEGRSENVVEETALTIADKLSENRCIPFMGIVAQFSVFMPYYSNLFEAQKFLDYLKNNISVARDCYEAFRGIIIVQFSDEWVQNGFNDSLNVLLDYVSKENNICFIFLMAGKSRFKNNNDSMYGEFTRTGIWLRLVVESRDIQQSVDLFYRLARDNSLVVSEAAGKKIKAYCKK